MATTTILQADEASFFSFAARQGQMCVEVPALPLGTEALAVAPCAEEVPYGQWNKHNHSDSYALLQKIAAIWDKEGSYSQYVVFGKQDLENQAGFSWQIIPIAETTSAVVRFWNQFLIVWKIIFGAPALSDSQRGEEITRYKFAFTRLPSDYKVKEGQTAADDPFCRQQVIERQSVLEGKTIRVLYDISPIGFGGERLHFLLVPKKHRQKFSDLTQEEYVEANRLAKKVIDTLSKTRQLSEAYLFHKTGSDAGQTVPHLHMHLILTANETQSFLGKLTVIKKMLVGASPLPQQELEEKVSSLREEFKDSGK